MLVTPEGLWCIRVPLLDEEHCLVPISSWLPVSFESPGKGEKVTPCCNYVIEVNWP